MNKKICRIGLCTVGVNMLLGSSLVPMQNTYASFAQERVNEKTITPGRSQNLAVMDKIISTYGLGYTYNEGFASYLSKLGFSKSEYKKYVDDSRKYSNSSVEKAYEIENLTLIFDQVVYTHPIVRSIYAQNLDVLGSKDKAWKAFKQGAIYDVDWMSIIFEESLSFTNMEKVYRYLFGKKPTDEIKADLNDKATIKYGLYSGVLKREISDDERKKIEKGLGYELLGVEKQEYDEYKKYLKVRDKIEIKEITFVKENLIHQSVRDDIKKQWGIDIYSKLSARERYDVYEQSLINYVYDKKSARKSFELLLMYHGYIKSPDVEDGGISEGGATNPVDKDKNPIITDGDTLDEYDYLDKDQPGYGIFGPDYGAINSSNKNMFTAQYYYKGLFGQGSIKDLMSEKFYVVKIGGSINATKIKVEEPFTDELLLEVLKTVFEEGNLWRVLSSQKEHLVFANNNIQTIKIEEEYSLKDLNERLKEIDVQIKVMTGKQISLMNESKENSKKESKEV